MVGEVDHVAAEHKFVMLFEQDGVNRRELCRRFGISPTIGYRLWARHWAEGKAGIPSGAGASVVAGRRI